MQNGPPLLTGRFAEAIIVREGISVFGRPGSDLLSQALRLSTIGAEEFNGRVRDGIGLGLLAKTTRPAKDRDQVSVIRYREKNFPLLIPTPAQAGSLTIRIMISHLIPDD
jgi:hypothetical protein